ncbi:polysaccharide biosynthesis protein, partial [Flavobacteriaceae bacterium]|nr:polysaccharide biosynthesis protein [Flavobacteriaceae bacterium]
QRDEITINQKANEEFYRNKNILVTGGAGSIGSEIIRQLIKNNPALIIAVDNSETALFHLTNELNDHSNIKFELLNITHKLKLKELFREHQFDLVFHAAAYKHVSVLENNPGAGLYNNILGTYYVKNCAQEYGVDKFVMISTDKAVNPTNVMGASKRFCELLVHFNAEHTKTEFVTTRFGNVLGSNGSVVPIFKEQIDKGGPITVTDPEITRYFMTIPEASKLVLEAGRIGLDKRIYVFDMGEPVKIFELAQNMVRLAGYEPQKDIDIVFTGLRSGEKLYEELLLDTEKMIASDNAYIFVAEKESLSNLQKEQIQHIVQALLSEQSIDVLEIIKKLKLLIPEYISNNSRYSVLDHE